MSIIKLPNVYLSREVYKGFIDQNHFLVQLDQVFDWHALSSPLSNLGDNDHGGRPRHGSMLMLKMLFVSFLFNLSDRDTEFASTNNLLVKYFLGLPIDEKAPDHTSLCRFRETVLLKKGVSFFDALFRSLTGQAKDRGIVFSTVAALDATHTLANVDAKKPQDPESPRDPDASWGCKGNETKQTSDGQKVQIPKYFFGYKAHLTTETSHGFITGIHTTGGHAADIDGGDVLIHRVMNREERNHIHVLLADKGYGCPVWINLLEKYTGIMTAFSLPLTMTKRGEHQAKWISYAEEDEGRKCFRRDRYVIERVNGDVKDHHGLRRCRYLGGIKYHLQTVMASLAHNAKFAVRILTGARLKPI